MTEGHGWRGSSNFARGNKSLAFCLVVIEAWMESSMKVGVAHGQEVWCANDPGNGWSLQDPWKSTTFTCWEGNQGWPVSLSLPDINLQAAKGTGKKLLSEMENYYPYYILWWSICIKIFIWKCLVDRQIVSGYLLVEVGCCCVCPHITPSIRMSVSMSGK